MRGVSARQQSRVPGRSVGGGGLHVAVDHGWSHPATEERQRLGDLLAPFGGSCESSPTPAEAELIKCAHNIYNAMEISF